MNKPDANLAVSAQSPDRSKNIIKDLAQKVRIAVGMLNVFSPKNRAILSREAALSIQLIEDFEQEHQIDKLTIVATTLADLKSNLRILSQADSSNRDATV
jgi:hypothetical protein